MPEFFQNFFAFFYLKIAVIFCLMAKNSDDSFCYNTNRTIKRVVLLFAKGHHSDITRQSQHHLPVPRSRVPQGDCR